MTEGRDAAVVTQADREIAACILEGPPWRHDRIAAVVRQGRDDEHELVRCAVTSRLAAEAAMLARVADSVRTAVWNACKSRGMSDDGAYGLINSVVGEFAALRQTDPTDGGDV